MKIVAVDNEQDMGVAAAQIVAAKLQEKADAVLGLATGKTPLSFYDELIKMNKRKHITFKKVKTINLDEYVGILPENRNSYRHYMDTNLFQHIDIDIKNTYLPFGTGSLDESIDSYKKILDRYPRDIQILGVGTNGHIGFNEPGTSFDGTVHVVNLSEQTIHDNSVYFKNIEQVPTQAITMGIREILEAKTIILMAGTDKKREAIRQILEGPISSDCPASILRKHKGLILIVVKNILQDIRFNWYNE